MQGLYREVGSKLKEQMEGGEEIEKEKEAEAALAA